MQRLDFKKASKELKADKNSKHKKNKLLPDCLQKIALAVVCIYLTTTTMGCASFYINGAKVYDPDPKENKKIYAAAGTEGTDASIGENNPWYKDWRYLVSIGVVIFGAAVIGGFAIYNHNKKDADPPPPAPPAPQPD